MTELELLRACLEHPERMGSRSVKAFTNWLYLLEQGTIKTLEPKRREWLLDQAERLGIHQESRNMVSLGRMKVTADERAGLAAFHESLGPKLTKPPGRK